MFTRVKAWFRAVATVRYLKSRGVIFGKNPKFPVLFPMVLARGKITIGDNFMVKCWRVRTQVSAGPKGELTIGNDVFINEGAVVCAMHKITIGNNTKIGDFATIYDTNFHEVEEGAGVKYGPVSIGRNVWIGKNAIILQGVSIGDNSVIGAGAIVTSSIPANSLAAGNPAKVIRSIKCSEGYIRKGMD